MKTANVFKEYLKKNKHKNITQKLNEVYNDDYYKEFEPISNAALESIRELIKNDLFYNKCPQCHV